MTYNFFMLVILLRFGNSEPSPLKSEILLHTDCVRSSRSAIEQNENPEHLSNLQFDQIA